MKNPTIKDPKWIEEYYARVSGSTSAASVGLDPYKTRSQLALEMRDPSARPDFSDNPNILKGVFGEKAALWWLQNAIDAEVDPTAQDEFWTNPKYPHAHCLPDATIDEKRICEVKVVGYGVLKRMKSFGVPQNYILQCQHNLAVSDAEVCHFGAFNFDYQDGYTEAVERNDELIEALMRNEAEFLEAVKSGADIADPAFEGSEMALPKLACKVVDDAEALEAAREFIEAKQKASDLEARIDGLKEYLQAAIGEEHTAFEFPGVGKGTWPQIAGRKGFDQQLCLAENPTMAKYITQGKSYRMFRLNPLKD